MGVMRVITTLSDDDEYRGFLHHRATHSAACLVVCELGSVR